MKLSVVIICWNDLRVIRECLSSIYRETRTTEFEVIVADNGSTDGSIEFIRANYPTVRIVENDANLGFARGNNSGIRVSEGDYVLILNPDTIIGTRSLDRFVAFADRHPEAGGFGCRILNPDGSYQISARPFPTIRRLLLAGLYLRLLGRLSGFFTTDLYSGWEGDSERTVEWQSGCCVLFRGDLLRGLGGFDERFFYQYEEVDLCFRVWQAGFPIVFTPEVTVTHLGGQSVGRFPTRFAVEKMRNRYRYFYKHYGKKGCSQCRTVTLLSLWVRQLGYSLVSFVDSSNAAKERLEMYRAVIRWNKLLHPVRFAELGEEPTVEAQPMAQSS